ncbi:MAG: response regulator [Desulfobacteraceae bacterium]|jgi:DNA-binding response OmpR family regulator
MKILLVDDEVEFVSALAERMSLRGIDVQWASKAEEAIIKAVDNCFDLAVLDVKMPGQSGIELKKQLQAKCPNMKFIFLTGHGSKEAYNAGTTQAGEDNYLLKPIKLEKLMSQIAAVLSKNNTETTNG